MRSGKWPCPILIQIAILATVAGGTQAANAAAISGPTTAVRQAAHPSRPTTARSALGVIGAAWRECGERGSGDPPVLVDCDYRAWTAADALVRRSGGNLGFRSLLNDLFDPLMDRLTGGEDALAIRVVVTHSLAELSLRRAAILTGESRVSLPREHVRHSVASLLRWPATQRNDVARSMIGPRAAQSWLRRWVAVRDQDCAAYPVPRCAEMHDGAFRWMIYSLLTDGGRQRLPPL
jgi:hypothetical protein